jgi:hypothetical protein
LKGLAHVVKESCTHINIQQKNPNFQTSNPTLAQLRKWTIFIPRIATFTYIHKVHIRIILEFLEKHLQILPKKPLPSQLTMQLVVAKEKTLQLAWYLMHISFHFIMTASYEKLLTL